MKKNSFMEGTIIASAAIIIVKILGALYVIPFYSIIGEEGGTLYSYAYNIYSLFLNITVSGIPIAMSKIISEYNTLGMQDAKEKSYKIGKKIILVLSLITFFALFVFSKEFAYIFIGNLKNGTNIEDISLVIKSVSFCLLVAPYISMQRGYLQGHKYIDPSSKSQVIEQIVRIVVILMGAYISINVLKAKVSIGVSVAVLGAFIGAIAAWAYLKVKINQNKKSFITQDKNNNEIVSNKEIIKKIIRYCIPFIIVSVSVNIYSVTDQALVIRGLSNIGYSTMDAEVIASIISTWGIKICMIINAIATGISVSLMPFMSAGRVAKDQYEINHKFNQALSVIFAISLPLTIGISILSSGVYTLFYGSSLYGGIVLKLLVFTAFFSSLDIVINVALQGLNRFKIIYFCTISGFLLNALLDIPLIYLCNKIGVYPYYGAIFATIIGYILSLSISLTSVKKEENLNFSLLINNIKKIILPLFTMTLFVYAMNKILPVSDYTGIKLFILLLIFGSVGIIIYILMLIKNKGFDSIFGEEYLKKILLKIKNIFKKKTTN